LLRLGAVTAELVFTTPGTGRIYLSHIRPLTGLPPEPCNSNSNSNSTGNGNSNSTGNGNSNSTGNSNRTSNGNSNSTGNSVWPKGMTHFAPWRSCSTTTASSLAATNSLRVRSKHQQHEMSLIYRQAVAVRLTTT
jgi:hypothetical protein